MKICAIICEYNPFHNGHLYQIEQAKKHSNADAVLCLMSGNFVQRGDAAIMEKHMRAKHAVLAGADIVIELPTVFATSNAELFAKGALHVLRYIPSVTTLCFGAEIADKAAFLNAATLLNNEPASVSKRIQEGMENGLSYAKARANAWEGFIPLDMLTSPNNILGLEYSRALLQYNANIEILPIQRVGSGYNQQALSNAYSSATAIRFAVKNGEDCTAHLPSFVAQALPKTIEDKLDVLEKYAILHKSENEIAQTCDCVEGLENALKRAAELPVSLVDTLTSARYTSSRIRRIALQNLLNVDKAFIQACLRQPLYLRVLAASKGCKEVLSALSRSILPLLVRAHDEDAIASDVAHACYERDLFAEQVHGLLYPKTETKELFY